MSIPTTHAPLRNYKNELHYTSQVQAITKKENNNRFRFFFSRCNPFNWFNDFRDIKISLEEFSANKNKHPNK